MKPAMAVGRSARLAANASLTPTPTLPRRERAQSSRYASFTLTKWLFTLLLCPGATGTSAAQEIKSFVRGSHQQIVSARAGTPFILSFWSLTCTNCRDDLALFGKLAKKHRNFDLVLVATDTPEQNQEIEQTLQRYRLERAESWVFADSYAERLRFEVDKRAWRAATPDNETRHARFPLSNFPPQAGERANESLREFHVKAWYGELPRTYFFNAQGKVESSLSGVLDHAQTERWIRKGDKGS